jgi:hypothetical protein
LHEALKAQMLLAQSKTNLKSELHYIISFLHSYYIRLYNIIFHYNILYYIILFKCHFALLVFALMALCANVTNHESNQSDLNRCAGVFRPGAGHGHGAFGVCVRRQTDEKLPAGERK